jgi:hypothetical protein
MDEDEYKSKYMNLKILKSIQEYLKVGVEPSTAVYPIKVPEELLYQVLKSKGPEAADELIHHIFKLGLTLWSDELFNSMFGSPENLEDFIKLVKERNKK